MRFVIAAKVDPTDQDYSMEASAVCSGLEVASGQGLSSAEGESRLARYGENAVSVRRQAHLLRLVSGQFRSVLVLVLGLASPSTRASKRSIAPAAASTARASLLAEITAVGMRSTRRRHSSSTVDG